MIASTTVLRKALWKLQKLEDALCASIFVKGYLQNLPPYSPAQHLHAGAPNPPARLRGTSPAFASKMAKVGTGRGPGSPTLPDYSQVCTGQNTKWVNKGVSDCPNPTTTRKATTV